MRGRQAAPEAMDVASGGAWREKLFYSFGRINRGKIRAFC